MPTSLILYDGWPLAYAPNSPAALHLSTILAVLPPEVHRLVALPAPSPGWLPEGIPSRVVPVENTPGGRRRWIQRLLPRLAKAADAALLHTTTPQAPLLPSIHVLVSPSGYGGQDRREPGLDARFGAALGRGGLARAHAVLWPEDLPEPAFPANFRRLPPVVHPAFVPGAPDEFPDLPGLKELDSFVFYHGPTDYPTLKKTIDSWSWAAGAIGSFYPLLLAGLDAAARGYVEYLAQDLGVSETIHLLPTLPVDTLALLYRAALALFHPAEASPWGGAVRHAIACARPVVSYETSRINALVGPAAFLAAEETPKLFGSGMIAMTVKEQVAIGLEQAAKKRAVHWHSSGFADQLLGLYRELT